MKTPLNVVVGETYSVPCARDSAGNYVPVVGPGHVDGTELCQRMPTPEHWHLDYRFTVVHYQQRGWILTGPIVYRDMVCTRERADNGKSLWAMTRLGRLFQNFRINPARPICPHNGQVLVNQDGQCPGHGFCWDMETGRPRFRYPYFVRFKGREERYPIADEHITPMPIDFDASLYFPLTVELIDSDGEVIGEQEFLDRGALNRGDVFKLVSSCLNGESPATAL